MRARAFITLWDNWDEVYKWGIELIAGKESIVISGHYYDKGENSAPAVWERTDGYRTEYA
jgi:hypothetical protein